MSEMDEAKRFFQENAGFSYDPLTETPEAGKARTGRTLADAERRLIAGPYYVSREADDIPWDGDVPWDGPVWVVTLWTVEGVAQPRALGSVGSVACYDDDPYLRVVAAELASEHI